MNTQSTIHRYGAHVDTDGILPGKYLNLYRAQDLAPHCMEGLDPDFSHRVKPGDVIIGDINFGTGSSREHAPMAIKASGIACIIATSFARIFYRNAINIGLPVFECPEIVTAVKTGDQITADITNGVFIVNGITYEAKPFPPYIRSLIDSGGLVSFVKQKMKQA